MNIRTGNRTDKKYILKMRPNAAQYFKGNSYFLVAEESDSILGFTVVFRGKIPAPVNANEALIDLIEVINENDRRKGIASAMVQKVIDIERVQSTYQIRAYCDINNIASHRLWHKNGFGIAPVKMQNGDICGSYVTCVLK